MRRRTRIALAAVIVPTAVVGLAACDTTNDTTYARAGAQGIVATPDLTYFDDQGAPLIHLDVLCNFGGVLQWRSSVERSVHDMYQGQTFVVYCDNYSVNGVRGVLSTSWQVTGRQA